MVETAYRKKRLLSAGNLRRILFHSAEKEDRAAPLGEQNHEVEGVFMSWLTYKQRVQAGTRGR